MASPAWSSLSALPRLDTSTYALRDGPEQHEDARESRSAQEARHLPRKPSSFLSAADSPSVARTDRGSTPDLFRSVADALGVDRNELPQPFYGVPWAHDDDDDDGYDDGDGDGRERDGGGDQHGGVHETSSTFIRRQPGAVPVRRDRNDSAASAVSPYSQPYHPGIHGRNPVATESAAPANGPPGRSSAEPYGDTSRPNHLLVESAWQPVTSKDFVEARDPRAIPLRPGDERSGMAFVERESMTPPSPFPSSGRPRLSSIVSPLEPSSPESSVKSPRYQGSVYSNPPAIPPKAPRRLRNDVEQALTSDSGVSRAIVVKPKAGLFEGHLVALLTLSDGGPSGSSDRIWKEGSEIKLQNAYYTRNLPSIRRAVESQLAPESIPSVWVPLEQMPLNEGGQILRRILQTWIQNANDDLYRRIVSIESKGALRKPSTTWERRLSRAVSKVLRVEQDDIGMNLSFANLGGDPHAAEELAVRFQSQGISIEARHVMEAPSLTDLAALANPEEARSQKPEEIVSEMFDLSPMQYLYFYTPMGKDTARRKSSDGDYRFNQSILLRLKQSIGVEDLRAAIEAVVDHHKMLRTRFRFANGSWWQSTDPTTSTSYQFAHHLVGTNAELESVATAAQFAINIEHGPVFAAHHFHTNDGYQLLYLVAHHLVVDLKSWQVVANDLERLLTDGHLVSQHSLTFKEWTLHQKHRVQTSTDVIDLAFELPARNWEYWGVKDTLNTYGSTVAFGFTLESEVTSVLEAANKELRTDSCDIFMSALLLSFAQTFRDRSAPILWNQEHERATLDTNRDISATVGWFTYLCPLVVNVSPTDDVFTISSRLKDARRAAAKTSLSHFTANLIDAPSAESFAFSHCPLELIFTYASALQQVKSQNAVFEELEIPGKAIGSDTADVGQSVGRIAIFEVFVSMEEGEAKLKFLHHRDSKHPEQIQNWIRTYERVLRQSIGRLKDYAPGLSMSDVPYLGVTPEGLNQLNRDVLPRLNLNTNNVEDIFPATACQQCVLVHQSLLPGSSLAQVTYELSTVGSALDTSRICSAWYQVTQQHPAMRTLFSPSVLTEGLYDQVVLRNHSPNMLFIECEEVRGAMAAIGNVPPLQLKEGIPWHRLIVCQSVGKAYLKLEVSQAICDVTSIAILFNELEQVYFEGHAATINQLSFPEYYQRLKLTSSSIGFWKEKLLDVRPCHFPHLLSAGTTIIEWQTIPINLQIPFQRLHDFARFYKVDKSTILRVAWGILLRTFLGVQDVCFGYRTSGRDLPITGLESAIGPFSRVLVGRTRALANQTIVQLLRDAQLEHRKALQHQHVPMSMIEHEVGTKGKRLFNTCVSFSYEDISAQSPPNRKLSHNSSMQASEYDINVDFSVHDGNLTVIVGHRILAQQQANTVGHVLGKAVETILESPSATVKESDLFTVHDHNQILAWNSMPQIDVQSEHLTTLISAQAYRNSDIQAVCSFDGTLTYAELCKLARGLAQYMLNLGVRPQMPLPVVVDKSRWAIVAMLAVLMVGGILIPIDSEATDMFPWIVQVIHRGIILASDSVRSYFESSGCPTIAVNEQTIMSPYVQAVELPMPIPTRPHDIACISLALTSPKSCKAVSYSHGALATSCAGQGPTLRINPSSRVMQLSSYSVDVALSEIFTTLVNGGCICIPSSHERISGFTAAAQRMRVNWTYLTPPLSRKLDPDALPDMAVVCFRATHLDAEIYSQWAGKAKVVLVYGSAEACPLGLSATEMTGTLVVPGFGNPFCGNFWVVSPEDHNRLMPVGSIGELVIGGATLSSASSLDMENLDFDILIRKSIARAQSLLEQSGSRLLKTGRLVRYREKGEIEFVMPDGDRGEVRGKSFRVSEIESQLRQCIGGGVDVVVEAVAFNDANSTPVFTVFLELGDEWLEGRDDLTNLDDMTRQRLFHYKQTVNLALRDAIPLPLAYVPVRRLPLTPSLRVNRRGLQKLIAGLSRRQLLALAEVQNVRDMPPVSFQPLPLTQVEQQMRALWAQVLAIEDQTSITAKDGFMTLGGDIVMGHHLVIICRQRGIEISILDILQNRTLSELCKGLASFQMPTAKAGPGAPNGAAQALTAPKLGSDRSVIEDVSEASSLQTMFVESAMLQARGNVSYFILSATGYLDWHKLENACFMLTKAHPILRTAFVSQNRQVYQTVLRSHRPEFLRYQCQNWRLNSQAMKLIKRDQPLPIDFRRPVTKFSFLDAGKSSILVMRLSRAQYDDLSIPILVRDLGRFYRQTGPITQGTGFCEVIRAVRSTYASGATEYWRSLLEGASITQVVSQPSLPVANSSPKTLQQKIPIGSLQDFDIPFESILKGAWAIVLSNLSGTDDVVFGHMVEGRHLSLANGQTISSVVGPKGNVIPVRTKIPDFRVAPLEYFKNIQSQYVDSIPYENLQTADVIQNCTIWPSWTRFSTVVHHQRQSERYKFLNFTIGEATCTLDMIGLSHEDSDVFVQTIMAGAKHVEVSVTFCDKKIQSFFAEEVLRMLCSTISVLTNPDFVMDPMILKGLNDSYTTPRIPLPAPKRESSVLSPVVSVDPDHSRTAHSIIATAWDTVFGPQTLEVADIRSVPFYEIWGAHMPAAELARYYTQKVPRFPGFKESVYTTEEIIDHPTMMQQYELIIAKQQETQLRRHTSFLKRNPSRNQSTRNPSTWGKNFRKLTVGTGTGTNDTTPNTLSAPPRLHPHRGLNPHGKDSFESLSTLGSIADDRERISSPPTSADGAHRKIAY
ncbi:putative non-ribosomal peptide synthetase [Rosellinia necatrix]|uniref:Putative non-ribosomal peptide synthetase n=1 Tax=Rosellinia necatrix TaxID=77044 RepID=A0A1W2TUG9_ROSNE|nr:putative non-ribosomal peptide synthetase [Rosellinia necatrix]